MERKKQDDGLSDVSDILEELKGMSLDMGKEISRYVDQTLHFGSIYLWKQLFDRTVHFESLG